MLSFTVLGGPTLPSRRSIPLPSPALDGQHSLEWLISRRRSVREFSPTPLNLTQIGQLLWAAQGITSPDGHRTTPSAGAIYPLELYLIAGSIAGLTPGVYRYQPDAHSLSLVAEGDRRRPLAVAALHQTWMVDAPAIFVIGAMISRASAKYHDRASRYVAIETGHAAENIFLQAESLGLATVDVGAFNDQDVAQVLRLPQTVTPLLLMPVGKPR